MPTDGNWEIVSLLNRYGLIIDTKSWPLLDEIFTKDALLDYGMGIIWTDLESFKSAFETVHSGLSTMHSMTSHQILRDGDRATTLCYGHWRLIRRSAGDAINFWEGSGWYRDRLVRSDNGWRITERVFRTFWWGGDPRVLPLLSDSPEDRPLPAVASLDDDVEAHRIAMG